MQALFEIDAVATDPIASLEALAVEHGASDEARAFGAQLVQGVLQQSALIAGFALTMLVLGWPIGATLAANALVRFGLIGLVLAIAAAGEYAADASPKIPSRTALPSIAVRPISGALAGWLYATMHGGSPLLGACVGIIGAFLGTYGGHAARIAAIARIGALPAALTEDVIAIALAAFLVTR